MKVYHSVSNNSWYIIHCNRVTSCLVCYKTEKIKYYGCRDFLLCSHKSCKEVISPGSQSAFSSYQRCLMGLRSGICAVREIFLNKLRETLLYGFGFVHAGTVTLKQEQFSPKLFPQRWKHNNV